MVNREEHAIRRYAIEQSKGVFRAESVESNIRFRTLPDNSIVQIGDEGAGVSFYKTTRNGQVLLKTYPKEIQ